jgi:hypothetical protein
VKFFISTTLFASLSVFYTWVAYLAMHPSVSDEYRFHYIVKNTLDWQIPRYTTDLWDGIDFSLPGYPSYVVRTEGIDSLDQAWGRWTDAKLSHTPLVVFEKPFVGQVCVELLAHPSSYQIGRSVRVRFGEASQLEIRTIDPEPRWYRFEMNLPTPAQTLVIQPEALGGWSKLDPMFFFTHRKHLGLRHLIVEPGRCKAPIMLK